MQSEECRVRSAECAMTVSGSANFNRVENLLSPTLSSKSV